MASRPPRRIFSPDIVPLPAHREKKKRVGWEKRREKKGGEERNGKPARSPIPPSANFARSTYSRGEKRKEKKKRGRNPILYLS